MLVLNDGDIVEVNVDDLVNDSDGVIDVLKVGVTLKLGLSVELIVGVIVLLKLELSVGVEVKVEVTVGT
jgi:hypothetical protein